MQGRYKFMPLRTVIILLILATYFVAFCDCSVLASNREALLACWRFNEGDGTSASDCSAYQNNGTLQECVWTIGKNGDAVLFDGTSYVEVPHDNSLNFSSTFSVACWINLAEVGTGRQILLEKTRIREGIDNSSYAVFAQWQHNVLALVLSDGTRRVGFVSDRGFSANTWHHITVTFGGGMVRFYIDGEAAGETPTCSIVSPSDGPLLIGNTRNRERGLHGAIDDLQIYNMALTSKDVYRQGGTWLSRLSYLCTRAPIKTVDTIFFSLFFVVILYKLAKMKQAQEVEHSRDEK